MRTCRRFLVAATVAVVVNAAPAFAAPIDSFFDIFVEVTLNGSPAQFSGTADLRYDSAALSPIPIQLVSLTLTGPNGATMTGLPTSQGQIDTAFPANSFFDIFVDIELPNLGSLQNSSPLILQPFNPSGQTDYQGPPITLSGPNVNISGQLVGAQLIPVPEPATMALTALGLAALALARRKRTI